MYKPDMIMEKSDDPDSYIYLFPEPNMLPSYLNYFVNESNNINIKIDETTPDYM